MACAICDDTGWKTIEMDGVARVTRCGCRLEQASRVRFANANIPTRYQHCTLDNFEAYNESLKRAQAFARKLVAEFPVGSNDRGRGLLLIGLPGVGKTHLAVAILKECIQKCGNGLFYTLIDLMVGLRSTYSGRDEATESGLLRKVSEADILVLDELGRERATEWRDEMLHQVVNARYSSQRPTIFTTNFDIGDIEDPDSLQVRVGMRIYSRLQEMCESMHLDAADYRYKPSNAGPEDLVAMWKMRKKVVLPSPRGIGGQARARLRETRVQERDSKGDLKWPGGRAGS